MVGHPSKVKEKNMARIRRDLVGSVLVTLPGSSDPIALTAGKKVPEGIELGDHVLEPESTSNAGTPDTSAADAAAAAKKAAKDAEKSAKKAAKKAAADNAAQKAPVDAGSSTPPSTDGELNPPPKSGTGSGADAWRDYAIKATKAAGLEVDIAADANRGDIVDALKSAGIRTE